MAGGRQTGGRREAGGRQTGGRREECPYMSEVCTVARMVAKVTYMCEVCTVARMVAKVASRDLPPLLRITSSILATFPIFYGICMEEHTCKAKLPHINGKW